MSNNGILEIFHGVIFEKMRFEGFYLTDTPGERQPYRQSPILAYHEFFWLK